MFQFTREFIINDNLGKLKPDGTKFVVKDGTMLIDNMVNIRKKDVNAIYKHPFEAEVKDKVTIKGDAITAEAGDVVRLVIMLGLQGKVSATFNDYDPDHSRELFYETIVPAAEGSSESAGEVAEEIIDGLLASVESEATLSKLKFANISKDGSDLVIEAPDCYTRIKEVRLVKLPQAKDEAGEVAKYGALLTGFEDWDPIVVWKRAEGTTEEVTLVEGTEGNGNTVQILKNMRLQTAANIDPYGLNVDERPLPKGQYDQFTVELVTERRHIGHDVMGSIGTSLTTLVFYVLSSAGCAENVSEEFEAALSQLCKVEEVAKISEAATPAEAEEKAMPKRVLAHTKDLEDEAGSSAE